MFAEISRSAQNVRYPGPIGLINTLLPEMRLSQPKGEASEFQAMLEAALKDIHPDYERNKAVRGIRTEYLREVVRVVFASHNALCMKGTYYHCFCITLHQELPTPFLHSPFTAGGRFDHNQNVNMAIQRDLGRHVLLSSSHKFRKGCERIIPRCTAEAEALLLPHYLSVFDQSRDALIALAECVVGDTPISGDHEAIRRFGSSIDDWDCDMMRYSALFQKWREAPVPFLMAVLASKPELFQRLREKRAIDPVALQK